MLVLIFLLLISKEGNSLPATDSDAKKLEISSGKNNSNILLSTDSSIQSLNLMSTYYLLLCYNLDLAIWCAIEIMHQ